jgi:hypothetical protein
VLGGHYGQHQPIQIIRVPDVGHIVCAQIILVVQVYVLVFRQTAQGARIGPKAASPRRRYSPDAPDPPSGLTGGPMALVQDDPGLILRYREGLLMCGTAATGGANHPFGSSWLDC